MVPIIYMLYLLGKEAGILHTEELMINQIICVEFVLIVIFTQAGALKITIS